MELFDTIGKSYSVTRQTDPRIFKAIIEYLDLKPSAVIADIGAGTGNYSYELAKYGYKVVAIEPSETMRKQGKKHPNLKWVSGVAENLPLKNSSVDGIVCTAAVQHFTDLQKSFHEMNRILKEPGVVLIWTVDPTLRSRDSWLDRYFAPFNQSGYPKIKQLAKLLENSLKGSVKTEPFLLPPDLTDRVFYSGWQRPYLYLDPEFCAGISPLAKAPKDKLVAKQERLRGDLESGKWEKQYGQIKRFKKYDAGYRFIIGRK